jgi:hypothetical protein
MNCGVACKRPSESGRIPASEGKLAVFSCQLPVSGFWILDSDSQLPTDLSYQKPTVPISQEYWSKTEIRAMSLGTVKDASRADEPEV